MPGTAFGRDGELAGTGEGTFLSESSPGLSCCPGCQPSKGDNAELRAGALGAVPRLSQRFPWISELSPPLEREQTPEENLGPPKAPVPAEGWGRAPAVPRCSREHPCSSPVPARGMSLQAQQYCPQLMQFTNESGAGPALTPANTAPTSCRAPAALGSRMEIKRVGKTPRKMKAPSHIITRRMKFCYRSQPVWEVN